jgi:hypothetical protein
MHRAFLRSRLLSHVVPVVACLVAFASAAHAQFINDRGIDSLWVDPYTRLVHVHMRAMAADTTLTSGERNFNFHLEVKVNSVVVASVPETLAFNSDNLAKPECDPNCFPSCKNWKWRWILKPGYCYMPFSGDCFCTYDWPMLTDTRVNNGDNVEVAVIPDAGSVPEEYIADDTMALVVTNVVPAVTTPWLVALCLLVAMVGALVLRQRTRLA